MLLGKPSKPVRAGVGQTQQHSRAVLWRRVAKMVDATMRVLSRVLIAVIKWLLGVMELALGLILDTYAAASDS
ncbi:hypothetical protein L1887_18412 [Cichorium endivia]|nr:hypothetical protein L1887_18412 [Cichorium endivia]